MNRVFVISDTHFGHANIIKFNDTKPHRPFATIEEHDRELVERWNAVVKSDDTVWHLGDVYFGKNNHHYLGYLKGIKKLVLGNHDRYPMEIYQQYFSRIHGVAEYGGCILTHVPVHPYQLLSRYKLNIHGHMHANKMADDRYVCVSVEQTGLQPILMSEAIDGTASKKKPSN